MLELYPNITVFMGDDVVDTAAMEALRLFMAYGYERSVALTRLFGKKEADRGFYTRVRYHLRRYGSDGTKDMYALQGKPLVS